MVFPLHMTDFSRLHPPDSRSGEPPAAEAVRPAQPADGAADGGQPPQVKRGESPWIGQDQATGEQFYIVPIGRKGHVKVIPIPYLQAHPYSAITDWLNFTFPLAPFNNALDTLFGQIFELFGPKLGPAIERPAGRNFYDRTFKLGESGAELSYGGNQGTCLLSLSGQACALVQEWGRVVAWGRDQLKGHISRWDGAIDDYQGTHSVDIAMQLYLGGGFGTGGRRPKMKQDGNWACPDGSGRTITIGRRKNGKRLQVYEKGMQLGAEWHPWTRWEVSLGNTGRDIPWEVLLEPGRYAVGAYPNALSWASKEVSRIATLQKQTQIGYDALIEHARNQYGPLLRLMRQVEGSAEKVLQRLERDGTPKRLKHPAMDKPAEWLE